MKNKRLSSFSQLVLTSLDFHIYWAAGTAEMPSHSTPPWTSLDYWLIVSPVKGVYSGQLQGGEIIYANPGEVILIPPRRAYTLSFLDGGFLRALGISFYCMGLLEINHFIKTPLTLGKERGRKLFESLDHLCRLMQQTAPSSEGVRGFFSHLMDQAALKSAGFNVYNEILKVSVPGTFLHAGAPHLDRIVPVLEYINQHYKENPDRSLMGKIMNVTPQRAHVLFKETLGMAPGEYIKEIRLSSARKDLLRSSRTISQIAASHNYCDPFHFSRQFKKRYGLSPKSYRKLYLKPDNFGTFPGLPPHTS